MVDTIDEDKDSAYASGPVWSPDSRLVAYVAWETDWYRDEKDALRSQAVIALKHDYSGWGQAKETVQCPL